MEDRKRGDGGRCGDGGSMRQGENNKTKKETKKLIN